MKRETLPQYLHRIASAGGRARWRGTRAAGRREAMRRVRAAGGPVVRVVHGSDGSWTVEQRGRGSRVFATRAAARAHAARVRG